MKKEKYKQRSLHQLEMEHLAFGQDDAVMNLETLYRNPQRIYTNEKCSTG